MKTIMSKDRKLLAITLFVCGVHAVAIGIMGYQAAAAPLKLSKPKSHVVVKTINLKKEKEAPIAMAADLPKQPPQQKQKPKPTPPPPPAPKKKIEAPKKQEKPKPEPKPKAVPKKEQKPPPKEKKELDTARKQLLKKAQESIAKIEQRSDKVVASLKKDRSTGASAPKKIPSLSSEVKEVKGEELSDSESAYRDELVAHMKLFVQLPEYGSVELKLTLSSDGRVAKVEILNTESERNKTHVKNVLPSLSFPPFGKKFGNRSAYTFHLTLTNE